MTAINDKLNILDILGSDYSIAVYAKNADLRKDSAGDKIAFSFSGINLENMFSTMEWNMIRTQFAQWKHEYNSSRNMDSIVLCLMIDLGAIREDYEPANINKESILENSSVYVGVWAMDRESKFNIFRGFVTDENDILAERLLDVAKYAINIELDTIESHKDCRESFNGFSDMCMIMSEKLLLREFILTSMAWVRTCTWAKHEYLERKNGKPYPSVEMMLHTLDYTKLVGVDYEDNLIYDTDMMCRLKEV